MRVYTFQTRLTRRKITKGQEFTQENSIQIMDMNETSFNNDPYTEYIKNIEIAKMVGLSVGVVGAILCICTMLCNCHGICGAKKTKHRSRKLSQSKLKFDNTSSLDVSLQMPADDVEAGATTHTSVHHNHVLLDLNSASTSSIYNDSDCEIKQFLPDETISVNLFQEGNVHLWEVIEEIGHGSYGKVSLVEHAETRDQLARKEISLKRWRNSDPQKEMSTLQKLDHPHIVNIINYVEGDEYIHIYMEYASGGTLADLIKQQSPICEFNIKQYVKQLISALDYMHKNRVFHRDIKPENILVFPNQILKFTDFGVSKVFEELSVATTVVGTPYYTAKEVFEGTCGRKSDIWSLGIVLYEMATGKLPWVRKNVHAIMWDISGKNMKPDLEACSISQNMKEFLKPMFNSEDERPAAETLRRHSWLSE